MFELLLNKIDIYVCNKITFICERCNIFTNRIRIMTDSECLTNFDVDSEV